MLSYTAYNSSAQKLQFLPRDAMHSTVMRLHVICPSVRLSTCDV